MPVSFTPLVESLPSSVPFVGPEALERRNGAKIAARIGANESVFGPSPKAITAVKQAARAAWQYCDPENHDLKHALARHLGVGTENVVVGEGIDGLFGLAVRLFVENGATVATSLGAYPTFNFHVAGFGGRLVTTPYVNDREDPESLLALAARENARLIFLANPDNPMGSWWPAEKVNWMIANLPEGTLLILDEAYGEFAPEGTLPAIDVSNPHVLRFRTFSKAYGLAGLRVGYAVGHADTILAFDKVRNHFGVTRVGQAAALAALGDQSWIAQVRSKVERARKRIEEISKANGLEPLPSATNFVTIDCGADGAYSRSIVDELLKEGVFIRMPGVAPLNRCVRVSAGIDADLDLLAEKLPIVLSRLRERTGVRVTK